MAIQYIKKEEIQLNFENGFAMTEMLPGTYPGVTCYRCALKAGSSVTPPVFSRAHNMLFLTDGQGYITTPKHAYEVDEPCAFFANFDEQFTVTAVTDMEWTTMKVEITDKEWPEFYRSHLALPYFRKFSTCNEYKQYCKTDMRSWHIVVGHQMYPIICGYCKSKQGATIEKGHPSVAQWNILYGNSDIMLIVGDEAVNQKAGDFSYVPAGPDHSLVTQPGKEISYIWFEHFTNT